MIPTLRLEYSHLLVSAASALHVMLYTLRRRILVPCARFSYHGVSRRRESEQQYVTHVSC